MDKTKEILEKLKKFNKEFSKSKKNNFFISSFFIFFLFLFLITNIYFSQNLSPIFLGLINNDKKSTVEFLKKIKNLNVFDQQLKYYQNFYHQSLKDEVFFEEIVLKNKLKKLEQVLTLNQKSSDVLYRISQVYKQLGDEKKAKDYFLKAKAVDPDL